MQNNPKNLSISDINEGSVIHLLEGNDLYLIESFSNIDKSDQLEIRTIGLSSSNSTRKVKISDITLASNEFVTRDSLFHSRDTCPLCLSRIANSKVLFTVKQLFWDIDVMSCLHCKIAYKSPLATPKLLSYIYTPNYTHHVSIETQDNSEVHRTRVERLGNVRGRHLDYGCGAGSFVSACIKAGWDSYGADPYLPEITSSTNLADRLFRIDATDPTLKSVLGKFDCISIWAAIEHLTEFKSTLEGLVSLLNPGGTIIFNSPNPQSLIAKYSGNLWRMATLIEHVQFCSPETLKYIASTYGMKIEKLRICGSPYPQGRASSILDQGLVEIPFITQNKIETNLVKTIPMRKSLISIIQRQLQGNTGFVATLARHIIHIFRLGDHIEVTLKLK